MRYRKFGGGATRKAATTADLVVLCNTPRHTAQATAEAKAAEAKAAASAAQSAAESLQRELVLGKDLNEVMSRSLVSGS